MYRMQPLDSYLVFDVETTGLDPDEKCYKTYAPGVGLIQDEDLVLTQYTKAKAAKGRKGKGKKDKEKN